MIETIEIKVVSIIIEHYIQREENVGNKIHCRNIESFEQVNFLFMITDPSL